MEDRYLYRAKRIDNEEWVEGYLVYDGCDGLYRIVIDVDYSTGTYIHISNAPRIDRFTICQCTGLKDKNGKLIWENDIIRHYNDTSHPYIYDKGIVKWDNNNIKFYRTSTDFKENVCINTDCVYEVIGNIFDNPELLGVEK